MKPFENIVQGAVDQTFSEIMHGRDCHFCLLREPASAIRKDAERIDGPVLFGMPAFVLSVSCWYARQCQLTESLKSVNRRTQVEYSPANALCWSKHRPLWQIEICSCLQKYQNLCGGVVGLN